MRDNKKNGDSRAPEKSEAASPVTPDQPLVIDLPDGQKLVVGSMVAGSVIEVATWRGTGRPDSRTSRLMLGMSPGSLEPTVVQTESEVKAKPTPRDRVAALLKSLQEFPKNLFIKKSDNSRKGESDNYQSQGSGNSGKSLSLKSDEPKSKRAFFMDFLVRSSHEQAEAVKSEQEQIDIDKWLDSIRSKPAPKTPPRKSTSKATPKSAKTKNAKPAARKSKAK